jgi:hypothetical protein
MARAAAVELLCREAPVPLPEHRNTLADDTLPPPAAGHRDSKAPRCRSGPSRNRPSISPISSSMACSSSRSPWKALSLPCRHHALQALEPRRSLPAGSSPAPSPAAASALLQRLAMASQHRRGCSSWDRQAACGVAAHGEGEGLGGSATCTRSPAGSHHGGKRRPQHIESRSGWH